MDIQSAKIELTKLILDINDPSLILKIKDMLSNELKKDHKNLSDQEAQEIKLGLEQLERGERISFDDFMKSISLEGQRMK